MYINAQKISRMTREMLCLISENESRSGETFTFSPSVQLDFFFNCKKLFYKFKNEFIVDIFTS